MSRSWLYCKTLLCCYAVLSLPYVALALSVQQMPAAKSHLDDAQTSPTIHRVTLRPLDDAMMRDVVVNSTTVTYNIPEDQQEIIYFRNFTEVGRRSQGFNIEEFDQRYSLERLNSSALHRLDGGDVALKSVAAGIAATVLIAAACVVFKKGCGQYIGDNIQDFVRASGRAGSAVVATAVEGAQESAGDLPVPGSTPELRTKRQEAGQLFEGFGCYYQDDYSGTCANEAVTGPAYQSIIESDGATEETPIWSCWESVDQDGTVFGYYTHCFGDGVECHLQCGAAGPEFDDPYNDIPNPPSS